MNNTQIRTRIVLGAIGSAAAIGLALGTAGCADSGSEHHASTTSSGAMSMPMPMPPMSKSMSMPDHGTHNEADVAFATMMIPHHRQAVEMADLVQGRTTNVQVVGMATAIKAAQQPEIDHMTAMLRGWGVNPDAGMPAGQGEMPGMMSDAQMSALRNAHGSDFDRLWLQTMISHHQGAIAMAETELTNGADPAAKALATQIKSAQQMEIGQMRTMLGR